MRILVTTALSVAAVLASGPAGARTETARVAAPAGSVLLNQQDWAGLRSRRPALAKVVAKCEAQMSYVATPTAAFGPDPHYNAAGLNPSANNGKQLAADAQTAYRAGLCHAITGDPRFAATAQRILDAWSGTLTRITSEQGKSSLNFNAPYMIAAASWVRGANGWDGTAFGAFLRTVVLPNSTSGNPNNHGMWGTLVESSAAAYLGDDALLGKARARWQEILKGAAGSDGTLVREIERSGTTNWRGGPDKGAKGIAYTHYFLLPASMAAKVFADQGQPVWDTEAGRLLGLAFAKAAAWTLRPDTFPYYASNAGKLEGVRSAAYFPLLLEHYPNADATAVLRQGDVGESGFLLPTLFARGAKKKN